MYNTSDAAKTILELIPNGVYPAVVTDWTLVSKDHVGYKVAVQFTEGPGKGRYLSDYFILQHHNEVAQKIGFGKICDFAEAAGIKSWGTEEELAQRMVGKEIQVEVVKAKDNRDGSDQNRMKTAFDMQGNNRSGHKLKSDPANGVPRAKKGDLNIDSSYDF